jgi:hypothetical protein
MKMDVIRCEPIRRQVQRKSMKATRMFADPLGAIRITSSVAVSKGKKTDEGTTMSPLEPESRRLAVADPPEGQTLTPATAKGASCILTNSPTSH